MPNQTVTADNIFDMIHQIRGEKVLLDLDLAMLYGVETRALKQSVKRNIDRFPKDFMFSLSKNEIALLLSQNVIPSWQVLGGAMPYAFTEHGVAMLSGVLKSKKAIEINIGIIWAFVELRKIASLHKELFERIENLEDGFDSLKNLVKSLLVQNTNPKNKIGFYLDQ